MKSFDRRELLRASAGTLAASQLAWAAGSDKFAVRDVRTISHLKHRYHGWPTLTRKLDGTLLLVCSGGRESHVCPFGRVELMRSHDGGETWSWPEVVLDGPIDDRDAGICVTSQGTLLVTTFTSLAYVDVLNKPAAKTWPQQKKARWKAAHERVSEQERQDALGVWMTRSTNNGATWSGRYPCGLNSPHGPVALADGSLLYAGKTLWTDEVRIGVSRSTDDGVSWQWLAEIPVRSGDEVGKYHELHVVEAADGSLVAHIRNHNPKNAGETLQSVSTDGGKTWTEPKSIGVWGLPSHLTRLQDDRLLMSYGHRRGPLGNQVRISADHGQSWSEPMILNGNARSGDLGYPSTVQLDDGSFVTVWYELLAGSEFAQLQQARWSLG